MNGQPDKKQPLSNKRQRPNEIDQPAEEPSVAKKQRIDPGAEVNQLFSAKPIAASKADMLQQRLVFKIVNSVKDTKNSCSVDQVWKRYMAMNDRETLRKGTNEPLINNKDELVQIVEALQNDNLVMYAAEDNQIILM